MHIVFFNRSFYPDTAATGQLLADLSEDLVRVHGCRVTVIAGMPLLSAEAVGASRVPSRETYRGVNVIRARGTALSKRRFIGRVMNYATYFLSACWAGLTVDRPDVVVALTDPPIIGLGGWLAARRHGAAFVMAYQDLFPEVAVLLEDFHSDTINRLLQALNRFLCRKADRIVALGDTMKERLITTKGAPRDKTVVIPSGADTRAIVPGRKRNSFAERHGLAERFVVMHSGNLGLSQGLDGLLDAAVLLRDVPDLVLVFQGDGVKKPALEARAHAEDLSNVMFLPFQPKDQLSESFAAADVFIVSLQAGLAGYIVPSKLYGILAAGRPYVAAVESDCEVAEITRRHECGLVVPPGRPQELAAGLRTLHADRAMAARMGERARTAGLSFDRGLQVAKYMHLFEAVAARPSAIPGKIAPTSGR